MSITIIVLIVLAVTGALTGYYFYRKHQRMLAAMTPEQRELYEAEREYKKSVKRAESELWWANSKHNLKVTSAEAALRESQKQGQKHLDSYSGIDGRKIDLWQNRIRVPQKEHYFENGSVRSRVDTAGNVAITSQDEKTVGYDTRELYLAIEGSGFASTIRCRPDDGPRVRDLAAKISNASLSIHSVLKDREQAIAQARRELEQTRNDRSGIEAATDELNAAKSDTKRLDAAREQAEKALPAPSETTAE